MTTHNGCRADEIPVVVSPCQSQASVNAVLHACVLESSAGKAVVMVVEHNGHSTMVGLNRQGCVRTIAALLRECRKAFGKDCVAEALGVAVQ